MITKEQVDEIIDKVDMVSLVSEFVPLERAGKGYKGLCPFHDDSNPSFMVSPDKKIAKCMSCGEGGNPITFLRKIKNISFEQAVLELSKKTGVKVDIRENDKDAKDYSKYYKIMELATKFYSRNMLETESGRIAISYLNKRGITEETIKMFNIGLAPSAHDTLYQLLKAASSNELDMLDLGLVKNGDKGFYDMFIKRIMFPIYDIFDRPIAFSGRIYLDGDTNQAKYLNSPETVLFHKSLVLFNLNNAIEFARKNKRLILHEGFMDVIASYRSDLKESICSMGTSLTIEQAMLIKKYTNNVIICYDGDEAGMHASLKAINILSNARLNVSLVMLPNSLDPDEYVKKYGCEAYKEFFNSHIIEPIEYQYQYALLNKNLSKAFDLEDTKQAIFKYLISYNSQVLSEKYLARFSEFAQISLESLLSDYAKYNNTLPISNNVKNYITPEKKLKKEKIVYGKYFDAQARLFSYAMLSKEKAKMIDSRITVDAFDNEFINLWFQLIDGYYTLYLDFDSNAFINYLGNREEIVVFYKKVLKKIESLNSIPHTDIDYEACIKTVDEYKMVKNFEDKKLNDDLSFDDKLNIINEQFKALKVININKNKK